MKNRFLSIIMFALIAMPIIKSFDNKNSTGLNFEPNKEAKDMLKAIFETQLKDVQRSFNAVQKNKMGEYGLTSPLKKRHDTYLLELLNIIANDRKQKQLTRLILGILSVDAQIEELIKIIKTVEKIKKENENIKIKSVSKDIKILMEDGLQAKTQLLAILGAMLQIPQADIINMIHDSQRTASGSDQ